VPVAGSYWATAIGIGGAAGVSRAFWGMSCPLSVALGSPFQAKPSFSGESAGTRQYRSPAGRSGTLCNATGCVGLGATQRGLRSTLVRLSGLERDVVTQFWRIRKRGDVRVCGTGPVSAGVLPRA
jgi:hypothetical protein